MRITLVLVLLYFFALTFDASAFDAEFVRASEDLLGNPHDIELSKDGHLLYVSDVNKNRIAVLNAQSLALVGSFGDGQLSHPHDVDLGNDGKIYVADSSNNRIAVFQPDGTSAEMVGEFKGPLMNPEGVLAHPSGKIIATGAWSGNAAVLSEAGVHFTKGGLSGPHDVEPQGDDKIWIADANNDRIVQYDLRLNPIKQFAGPPYGFKGPRYLAYAADGTLWVADKYTHRVLAVESASGDVKLVLGTGRRGKGPGLFTTPEGVVTRGDQLWISDSGNNRVVLYRLMD